MEIEQVIADKDQWFTQEEAKGYYGITRSIEAIVIHHWNSPAARPSFNGNLDYLLHNNSSVSANSIIGFDELQNKVCIVDSVIYPNVAFTTGGVINAKSVSIECDPWGEPGQPYSDEILKAIGFRVSEWRKQFGFRVPLKRHKDYKPTDCPGNYDLSRIDQESDKWASGAYNPPVPSPSPVKITFTKLPEPRIYITNKEANLWEFNYAHFNEVKSINTFPAGTQITVFGYANNPVLTSNNYLMTKYSFDNADADGTPAHYWGFNQVDLDVYQEAPTPTPEPPTPEPPTPDPVPEPTPEPEPTPDPIPPVPPPPVEDTALIKILKAIWSIISKIFKKGK